MKSLLFSLNFSLFICFFSVCIYAQQKTGVGEDLLSIENLSAKLSASDKGNFSILLPESNEKFLWNFKEGEIRLNFFDLGYFVKAFDEEDFKAMVERLNFDTMVNLKAKILEDLSKTDLKSKTATTYLNLENGKVAIQKFQLVEKRLYVILAVINDRKDQEKFESKLKTFKTTKRTDSDFILKTILHKITASALPQSPIVVGEKNDLSDENLKGKVKQINWYSQDLHYPVSERKHFTKIQEFDRRGYLTKETSGINFGNPYSVEVFGFINGKRVSFFGFDIPHFSLFPPTPEEPATVEDPNVYLKSVYDERYTTAFEKRYKNGKLSEKKWYNSAGRITYRRTYEYKGNQVTAIGYDFNGNLVMKTVSVFDKDGNYASETRTDRGDSPPFAIFFQYELDNKGNWIKQIHTLKLNIDGRESLKPQYAILRTIEYYK